MVFVLVCCLMFVVCCLLCVVCSLLCVVVGVVVCSLLDYCLLFQLEVWLLLVVC